MDQMSFHVQIFAAVNLWPSEHISRQDPKPNKNTLG